MRRIVGMMSVGREICLLPFLSGSFTITTLLILSSKYIQFRKCKECNFLFAYHSPIMDENIAIKKASRSPILEFPLGKRNGVDQITRSEFEALMKHLSLQESLDRLEGGIIGCPEDKNPSPMQGAGGGVGLSGDARGGG